jgi:hypothetical protein
MPYDAESAQSLCIHCCGAEEYLVCSFRLNPRLRRVVSSQVGSILMMGVVVKSYEESTVEFASFIFERQKVVCYGLLNNAGGNTTVLNFPSESAAVSFQLAFIDKQNFQLVQNDAQLICFADYETVMRKSEDDARVRHLNYSRDFMMGTLAHVS